MLKTVAYSDNTSLFLARDIIKAGNMASRGGEVESSVVINVGSPFSTKWRGFRTVFFLRVFIRSFNQSINLYLYQVIKPVLSSFTGTA